MTSMFDYDDSINLAFDAKIAGKSLVAAKHELLTKTGDFLFLAHSDRELALRMQMIEEDIEKVAYRKLSSISDSKAKLVRVLHEEWSLRHATCKCAMDPMKHPDNVVKNILNNTEPTDKKDKALFEKSKIAPMMNPPMNPNNPNKKDEIKYPPDKIHPDYIQPYREKRDPNKMDPNKVTPNKKDPYNPPHTRPDIEIEPHPHTDPNKKRPSWEKGPDKDHPNTDKDKDGPHDHPSKDDQYIDRHEASKGDQKNCAECGKPATHKDVRGYLELCDNCAK